MVAYTTAPGDLEMGREERTVVLVEKKSSLGCMWKVCIALLFLTLCFGGLMLFAWYWSGRPDVLEMLSDKTEALSGTAETEPHHTLKRIGSNAKAAIHLEGKHHGDRLEWKNQQGQAFIQGDFRLENNEIIIPSTGVYFVYSQASFSVFCGEEEGVAEDRLIPLSHKIWCFSDALGKNTTLMSAMRSPCHAKDSEDRQDWYNTIYLGAVFKLNRGDKLWTETNQLAPLETRDGKTFFGVFAL